MAKILNLDKFMVPQEFLPNRPPTSFLKTYGGEMFVSALANVNVVLSTESALIQCSISMVTGCNKSDEALM